MQSSSSKSSGAEVPNEHCLLFDLNTDNISTPACKFQAQPTPKAVTMTTKSYADDEQDLPQAAHGSLPIFQLIYRRERSYETFCRRRHHWTICCQIGHVPQSLRQCPPPPSGLRRCGAVGCSVEVTARILSRLAVLLSW